jgi:hypothetical protein
MDANGFSQHKNRRFFLPRFESHRRFLIKKRFLPLSLSFFINFLATSDFCLRVLRVKGME